jgi:hypothetical protein
VSLVGTRGSLLYDYARATELRMRPTEGASTVVPVSPHETRFTAQLIAFAEFTRGTELDILASFADALHVAELVDQAQRESII